jgi:predicted house-cleaning noncanonical NTP pyrophosphatase (MazG superfamily)
MLEVMGALAKAHGATTAELIEIQLAKKRKRGGFEQSIFLIDVDA